MKNKVLALLEPEQVAHVEKKAKARGIAEIWQRGIDAAASESPAGTDDERAALAAVRAQQIAGCIPKLRVAANAAVATPAAEPTLADAPSTPPVAKKKEKAASV